MMKGLFGIVGAVIGLVLFLSVNLLSNEFLGTWRWDNTEHGLFTLSEGSEKIAAGLDEPIRLTLYFSEESGRQIPEVVSYRDRVRAILKEYARNSGGKLILEERNPERFSEEEERAVNDGITGIPIGPDPLYFGLVGTNAIDQSEVIPFFGDISRGTLDLKSKERFLEYDISRLIYSLAHPEKQKVGVVSALPIGGGPPMDPRMRQQPEPAWKFLDELRRFFDVEVLETTTTSLPADLDLLLVVHPRQFSEALLYSIDQYVMGGGKLVAFVDPHCEVDLAASDPNNPMGNMGASKASDLNRLFSAWGFEMTANTVIADRASAIRQRLPDGRGSMLELLLVPFFRLTGEALSTEDPITSLLDTMIVAMPGSLHAVEGASTTFEPLLESSEEAMELDATRLQFRPDWVGMVESYVPGGQKKTLGARVSGEAVSAFPDGAPAGVDTEDAEDEEAASAHLATSDGPINVIAFADVDMLHDRMWISESRLGQFSLGWRKTSDNCDLLTNAVGNLTGGEDLISIRARGRFARPFETVDEIRAEAEARYLSEEQELQRAMQDAEREIVALQNQRDSQSDPDDPASRVIFSPEIQATYDQFLEQKREIGRKLRDVQHERDKDIDALGFRLKVANVLGMPTLIVLAALGLALARRSRQTG